jgi:hypothetical protein
MPIDGLTLYFDPADRDNAEPVRQACEKTLRLNREVWGLDAPDDCRVYIMRSWFRFVFHSAPWPWRILLGVTLPLWAPRTRRMWKFAGGWEQRYGKRRAVGIKPPDLLQLADRSMGERIFIQEEDLTRKVQQIVCHELTHALSSHLMLPTWLKEGLAMVAVDRFVGRATVRPETIESLAKASEGTGPGSYGRRLDPDSLVQLYVRGYWITRYLDEAWPELLRGLLSSRRSHSELEHKLANALGIDEESFWKRIDPIVVSHFDRGVEPA